MVVQSGTGESGVRNQFAVGQNTGPNHFFFWVLDNLIVNSPTMANSAWFSFLSLATSSQDGISVLNLGYLPHGAIRQE